MPFDARLTPRPPRQKIAIVGTGISGLSSAWLLSQSHDVTVYEKDSRLGGHANTVDVTLSDRIQPVDTGFIVFNAPSYPNFVAMLDHLDVASEESCMSFAASIDDGRVEYSGQGLSAVFARRRNAASPTFWRMLGDIPRFHRDAKKALEGGLCEHASLGDFVRDRGYGHGFSEYFLKPMASAIWSTPQLKVFDYPAVSFFRFFENHGLLRVLNGQHWRTVSGGSHSYVRKFADALEGRIRISCGVTQLERRADGVWLRDDNGGEERFDQVVLASHADAALDMHVSADDEERSILSGFSYQPNTAVLHFDESQMPNRRRAWASWNYLSSGEDGAVSYWMNRLQNYTCKEDIFVTLNPVSEIREDKVVGRFNYDHPMYNAASHKSQADIWRIQGRGGVWYAGAHLGFGFHEDGLQAGLAVAEAIGGVRRPWSVAEESARLRHSAPISAAA